jgi:hypothetical protein
MYFNQEIKFIVKIIKFFKKKKKKTTTKVGNRNDLGII